MKVVEIFNSIEGEGARVGLPTTFIRLFGCNLNCSYCDSQYACREDEGEYTVMSVEQILEHVECLGCPHITITGGEPLIHPGVSKLITELAENGYFVNVETNGTQIPRIFQSHIFYTVDYKTNASGMSDKMNFDAFACLRCLDVVKFVVGSISDLEQSLEAYEKMETDARVYVSPVFGQIDPKEIVGWIQDHHLWNWHTQVQLHKIIYDPEQRGV